MPALFLLLLSGFYTDGTYLPFESLEEHLDWRLRCKWKMEFAAVAAFIFLLGREKASSDY